MNRFKLAWRILIAGLKEKKNPAGGLGLFSTSGGIQEPLQNKAAHLAVYNANVWCNASIKAIAEAVAAVPLVVQKKIIVDGKITWELQEEGDLYDVIKRPNNDDPMTFLVNKWVASMYASGDGYLIYDSADNELYLVKSDFVKVKVDSAGQFNGYVLSDGIKHLTTEPAQVVHIRLASLDGTFYGLPPSKVVEDTILTDIAMTQYLKSFFKNSALAGTTFSTDEILDVEQRAILRQEFERMHKGVGNAFGLAILDGGTKLDKLSHALKDLAPVEITRIIRETILAVYGVPHVVVGILDDASYANAHIQKRIFYENVILPTLIRVESFMNLQFVPQFGEDLRVWFDRAVINAIQEDTAEKAKRIVSIVDKVITVNESRIELGYEPFEGDEFNELRKPAAIPSFGSEESIPEDDDKCYHGNKASVWKAHKRRVTAKEIEYARLLQRFFNEQEKRVLARINKLTLKGEKLSSIFKSDLQFMHIKGLDEDVEVVFNLKFENKELLKTVKPTIRKNTFEAGRSVFKEFGLTYPGVPEMLNQFYNRSVFINDTTFEALKDVMQIAIDEGWNASEVSSAIRDEYKHISKVRADRIAKTEMNGVINGGKYLGHVQRGDTHKQWSSAFLPTSIFDAFFPFPFPARRCAMFRVVKRIQAEWPCAHYL